VLGLSASVLTAQSNTALSEYQQTPINIPQSTGETWRNVTGGETFSEKPVKENPNDPNHANNRTGNNRDNNGSGNSSSRSDYNNYSPSSSGSTPMTPMVQVIVYAVLITGLLLLIAFVVTGGFFNSPNNPNVGVKAEFNIENVDASIPESELQRLLRESLSKQNYRAAVRLYYITIVKHLADKQYIQWQRDKTNLMYCREMRDTPHYQPFSSLTRVYERVWFSDHQFDQNEFERVKPDFEKFLSI